MNTNISKTDRQINLDVLRVLSMLLIILFHSIIHSGVLEAMEIDGGFVHIVEYFFYAITQVCVNLYVLISGYFLVNSKFKVAKLIQLWLEVVFYSLVQRLIFIALGVKAFSVASVISCFFPVITGRYWFVTIYFGMYLLFPFFNIVIHAMKKEQHTALNVILFILLSGMVTLHPSLDGLNKGGGWGIAWFIVLYFAAAWFRLYYQPNGKWVGKLLGWLGIGAFVVVCVLITQTSTTLHKVVMNWYRYDSAPSYIASLILFAAFLNIKFMPGKLSKLVLYASSATFGVYLIHDHADTSVWLWKSLDLPSHMSNLAFPLFQIGSVIAIFVVCVLIDLLRQITVGRVEKSRLVFKIGNKITNMFDSLMDTVESRLITK